MSKYYLEKRFNAISLKWEYQIWQEGDKYAGNTHMQTIGHGFSSHDLKLHEQSEQQLEETAIKMFDGYIEHLKLIQSKKTERIKEAKV